MGGPPRPYKANERIRHVFFLGRVAACEPPLFGAFRAGERADTAAYPLRRPLGASEGYGSRPLIVDFTAAWCGACKELDKLTFSTAPVGAELSRFVAVRVDATNDEDPKVGAALKRFGVRGLPTVVVFDSRGKEALRFTDFVPPERFLSAIRQID